MHLYFFNLGIIPRFIVGKVMSEPQSISRTQVWLDSLRLRTLPIAVSSIIVGCALAWQAERFDPLVALLALITASLLQILSNLANDYGDAVKGSDKPDRLGPLRGMQKGLISQGQMKRALYITVLFTCLSGLVLLMLASHNWEDFWGFLLLGLLSVIAAITYTVGTRPYGYMGLGDLSVLLFFGWLSVLGCWYLQVHTMLPVLLLPATGCGLMATAVLNINNLRDINSDRENGKNTLAVRLGPTVARRYHAVLMFSAVLCFSIFNLLNDSNYWCWLFILTIPIMVRQVCYVLHEIEPASMRTMLGPTVKVTLLTNILFSVGLVLSHYFS